MFLQQLGRGLRRAPGKACLTVLDFVGQHDRRFRWDVRYRALTGVTRSELIRQIEHGFPFLPAGSAIQLDRVARQVVLDNVTGSDHPAPRPTSGRGAQLRRLSSLGEYSRPPRAESRSSLYGAEPSWTAFAETPACQAAPGPGRGQRCSGG